MLLTGACRGLPAHPPRTWEIASQHDRPPESIGPELESSSVRVTPYAIVGGSHPPGPHFLQLSPGGLARGSGNPGSRCPVNMAVSAGGPFVKGSLEKIPRFPF